MKLKQIKKSIGRNKLVKIYVALNRFDLVNFPKDTPNDEVIGAMRLIKILVGERDISREWNKQTRTKP